MERYDPETDVWKQMPSMSIPRNGAGSAIVGDNLCVAGGYHAKAFQQSAEAFDFETEEWYPLGKITMVRQNMACAALGQDLIIMGGTYGGRFGKSQLKSVERHSFETHTVSQAESMESPRSHFACCVHEGKILVTGGIGGNNVDLPSIGWGRKPMTDCAEWWGPGAGLCRKPEPMKKKRRGHVLCVVKGFNLPCLGPEILQKYRFTKEAI